MCLERRSASLGWNYRFRELCRLVLRREGYDSGGRLDEKKLNNSTDATPRTAVGPRSNGDRRYFAKTRRQTEHPTKGRKIIFGNGRRLLPCKGLQGRRIGFTDGPFARYHVNRPLVVP